MKNLITKEVVLYLVFAAIIIFYGSNQLAPKFKKLSKVKTQLSQAKPKLRGLEQQANIPVQANEVKKDLPPVKIFSPKNGSFGIENDSVELVEELIYLIKDSNVYVKEISYAPKGARKVVLPHGYSSILLSFSLNSEYKEFGNLIKKIFSWNYLVGIKNINVNRSFDDKNKIDIDLTLELFIKS